VDHQAETREAAAPLEEPAYVRRQGDPLPRDAVDGAARLEHVGHVEPTQQRVFAIVRLGAHVDGLAAGLEHADLVAQREIHRGHAELVRLEGRDHDTPGLHLGEDRVAREHAHRRRMIP
jgi:hypothetical protein